MRSVPTWTSSRSSPAQRTPVFVGSALTNFGVRKLLDAVVELAPQPAPRADVAGNPHPLDAPFSAFVFKVQANMDPSHRDRIAFARICSGTFERGMSVTNSRTGRDMTTKYATTAFGADRETVDLAYPGDVVGLVNASGVLIGDTLYGAGFDGGAVEFPQLPRFAPEVFARARPMDNGKAKQFRKGLEQLDEEGVVQRRCSQRSVPCSSTSRFTVSRTSSALPSNSRQPRTRSRVAPSERVPSV